MTAHATRGKRKATSAWALQRLNRLTLHLLRLLFTGRNAHHRGPWNPCHEIR